MGLHTNILRRGATYAWRKRLPSSLGGAVMQISLRTNDPLIARRLALIVSAESVRIFDRMAEAGLSREDAAKLLRAVIAEELQAIELRRAAASDETAPDSWQKGRSADWAMAKALMLVSERGAAARELEEEDIAALLAEGRSRDEVGMVETCADMEARAYAHPPMQGGNSRPLRAMRQALGAEDFSAMEFMQGRQIWYRGRAAALLTSLKRDHSFDAAMDLAAQLAKGEDRSQPAPAPKPAPDQDDTGYDPAISALIARWGEQKRHQKVSEQMITQMTRVFGLFVEATGLQDIRELRQSHVARFVDVLHRLPKTYRKSEKDRDKPLSQILAEAGGYAAGLSDTTIGRDLNYLSQLLTKARSEGFTNVMQIDLGSLRPRKVTRDRDDRPAFTAGDVQRLFTHPVWQGNLPKQKWQKAGLKITRDGLYWLPLIAALSGARREEIAGLKASDIAEVDGIPAMRIAPNANRGLKTPASHRTLPLHPQLIELGLVEHARARRTQDGDEADLFPELRPGKAGAKFGERIDYRFRLLVLNRLGDDAAGKVFHSFRHYVATQLGRMDGMPEALRKDILGHKGADITSERYSEGSPLAAMRTAIERLPRLPVERKPER